MIYCRWHFCRTLYGPHSDFRQQLLITPLIRPSDVVVFSQPRTTHFPSVGEGVLQFTSDPSHGSVSVVRSVLESVANGRAYPRVTFVPQTGSVQVKWETVWVSACVWVAKKGRIESFLSYFNKQILTILSFRIRPTISAPINRPAKLSSSQLSIFSRRTISVFQIFTQGPPSTHTPTCMLTHINRRIFFALRQSGSCVKLCGYSEVQ